MTSIQRFAPGHRITRGLVLALAAVLLGTAVITQLFGGRAQRSPVQELARHKPQRSFAPRLSIPTRYRECTSVEGDETVPREECGTSDEGSLPLGELAAGGESSDPDSLQASALAAMIWWDESDEQAMDAAIDHLNKALRLTLNRVPLLVDLSAAHLVRAERTHNPRDLFAGLNYAYLALAREPRNTLARFNAALALQVIGLDQQAALEWNAFLAVDSTSPWAHEARQRRRRLITQARESPVPVPGAPAADVKAFTNDVPERARQIGFDSILGQWGGAVETGKSTRADSLLVLAEELGRALEQRPGGDASLAAAVRAIRAASPDARAMLQLAQAHQAFAEGQVLFRIPDAPRAMAAFTRVIEARPPSPVLLQWATIFQAATHGYLNRPEEAEQRLSAELPHVDATRYPALAGRGRLMLGTMLGRLAKYSNARAQFEEAVPLLERAGEREYAAASLGTDADVAYELGDTVAAYRSLHGSVQVLRRNRRSPNLHKSLVALGRFAEQDEMPYAAWAIYNEDVSVAGRGVSPVSRVEVRLKRADVRMMLGDSAGAERDMAYAAIWQDSIPDDNQQKEFIEARIRMSRPEGISTDQMDLVVEALASNVVWHVSALIWRADRLLAADSVVRATEDLYAITEGVGRLAQQQGNAVFRGAIIEQAKRSFDRLVMLHLQEGRPDDALRALEAGRMSFAPRRLGGGQPSPGRLVAPRGHVGVEYALIGDTLLTWTVGADPNSLRLWRQPVDRDAFLLEVEQAGAALESVRAPIPQRALRHLYDVLIRPIRNHMGARGTPLIILADGEVAGVPFAALMDGYRYLIEDRPLRFAATLTDASRPRFTTNAQGPALLVADPAFDPLRYPRLERLDGARAEVDSLQSLFPTATRLDSAYATRDAFTARAQSASLIHYAGHAIFDDARPERSYLVLAGADTMGRLTAEAVSEMELGGVRLVVLSACRTLRSREGRSGGFAGLSGALLSAGAGGVVGSLWQVNDGQAEPLMMAFHRAYRRLKDPALALREAQLEMLHSGNPTESSLASWAGFRYTGH